MKFTVMVNEVIYRQWFKTVEAETAEEANDKGWAEIDGMSIKDTPQSLGWREGDESTDFEPRPECVEREEVTP